MSIIAAPGPFDHLGTPTEWKCPDCGTNFVVFPALPFDHEKQCRARLARRPAPRTGRAYYELDANELVKRFVVVNAYDPNDEQRVISSAPGGAKHEWEKRWEGDLLVFYPPSGYDSPHQPVTWLGNRDVQVIQMMSQPELEARALGGKRHFDMDKDLDKGWEAVRNAPRG